jgi:hypothetical protein
MPAASHWDATPQDETFDRLYSFPSLNNTPWSNASRQSFKPGPLMPWHPKNLLKLEISGLSGPYANTQILSRIMLWVLRNVNGHLPLCANNICVDSNVYLFGIFCRESRELEKSSLGFSF